MGYHQSHALRILTAQREIDTHLRERRLTRIGNHRERRDNLLLDISLWRLHTVGCCRVEQTKQALDDRVQVW